MSEIIFVSFGFTFAFGAHSISEEVVGFSPLRFPRGKFFVSLVACDYCYAYYYLREDPSSYLLNDKNLTVRTLALQLIGKRKGLRDLL